MRRATRLVEEGTCGRLLFLAAPEHHQRAHQDIDRYVLRVMDDQRRVEARRAGNFKEVEYAARLFCGRLDRDYRSEGPEELSFFVQEHVWRGLYWTHCSLSVLFLRGH